MLIPTAHMKDMQLCGLSDKDGSQGVDLLVEHRWKNYWLQNSEDEPPDAYGEKRKVAAVMLNLPDT